MIWRNIATNFLTLAIVLLIAAAAAVAWAKREFSGSLINKSVFFIFPLFFPFNPHLFPLFCSSFRFKVRFLCFHIFLFLRLFYLALGCVVLCVRFR